MISNVTFAACSNHLLVLHLYWEYGTAALVILEASSVDGAWVCILEVLHVAGT